MNKNIYLNAPLSRNSSADPEDTLNVKRKLNQFGYMELPSYGIDDMPDEFLFDGIKKFQNDNDLKVDGIMKPGGETEKSLNSKNKKEEQNPSPISSKDKTSKRISPGHIYNAKNPEDVKKLKQLLEDRKNKVDGKPTIEAPVGVGQQNDPKDIHAIKTLLEDILPEKENGLDKSSTITPDFVFDIQQFQKSNDLKIDGVINPDGETQEKLNSQQRSKEPDPQDAGKGHAMCNKLKMDIFLARDFIDKSADSISDLMQNISDHLAEIRGSAREEAVKEIVMTLIGNAEVARKEPRKNIASAAKKVLGKIIKAADVWTILKASKGLFMTYEAQADFYANGMEKKQIELDQLLEEYEQRNCEGT